MRTLVYFDEQFFLSCRSSLRLAVRRLRHAANSRQSHNALLNPTSVSQSAMFQLHALWFNLAGSDCENRGTIDICDFSPHLTTILPALILNTRRADCGATARPRRVDCVFRWCSVGTADKQPYTSLRRRLPYVIGLRVSARIDIDQRRSLMLYQLEKLPFQVKLKDTSGARSQQKHAPSTRLPVPRVQAKVPDKVRHRHCRGRLGRAWRSATPNGHHVA